MNEVEFELEIGSETFNAVVDYDIEQADPSTGVKRSITPLYLKIIIDNTEFTRTINTQQARHLPSGAWTRVIR